MGSRLRLRTISLFAALNIATGHVIGRCYQRHRAVDFRKFMAAGEQAVPAELDVHLVLDSDASHKASPVTAWLTRHPHYHLHFTPTSASWLNHDFCKMFFNTLHPKVSATANDLG